MTKPLLVNTLDEAAKWLTNDLGKEFSSKDILNFELSQYLNIRETGLELPQSKLIIALPRETTFSSYRFVAGDGFIFTNYENWMFTPMYQVHLWEMLIHGETRVSIAKSAKHESDNYIFIEPILKGQVATIEMIRIKDEQLIQLFDALKLSNIKDRNITDISKLTEAQQDKLDCQSIAKGLWDKDNSLTQKAIKQDIKMQPYLKKWNGKNTISNWLSEIDPRPRNARRGRPKITRLI